MINTNKSLVIFSHYRSGSTWFQSGLPHLSAFELFNLDLIWKSHPHRPEFKNSIAQYYTLTSHVPDRYYGDDIDMETELNDRFSIYNELESKHFPISLKVHTCHVNDKLIKFLSTKDLDYVLIERRDKVATFWSHIISLTTSQFHFFEPKAQEITITKEHFKSVADKMLNFQIEVNDLKKIFPIQHMYYEDILNLEISEWWVRPNNRIKIQNAAKITTITNRDEVMSWIEEIDLFNRI